RPRAQAHRTALWRLRARARSDRVALSGGPADDLRGRDQRRQSAPAVAAQLLLRLAARDRSARARRFGGGRGAGAGRERRGELRKARLAPQSAVQALAGALALRAQRAILTTLS